MVVVQIVTIFESICSWIDHQTALRQMFEARSILIVLVSFQDTDLGVSSFEIAKTVVGLYSLLGFLGW